MVLYNLAGRLPSQVSKGRPEASGGHAPQPGQGHIGTGPPLFRSGIVFLKLSFFVQTSRGTTDMIINFNETDFQPFHGRIGKLLDKTQTSSLLQGKEIEGWYAAMTQKNIPSPTKNRPQQHCAVACCCGQLFPVEGSGGSRRCLYVEGGFAGLQQQETLPLACVE